MVAMKKADLLDRLRGGITEEQWTALADGRLKISDFNRAVLLEMRNAHAKVYGEVDEARVSGLRAVTEDYLRRYLSESPEAWRWIVIAGLYLTFIAERPMHPIEMLHIVEKQEQGRAVYECPAKSDEPRTTCHYCVCGRPAPCADERGRPPQAGFSDDKGCARMKELPIIRIELKDTEWPLTYTDHDRQIVRAIVVDDAGDYYFVRAVRDDEFGAATLIETSGGGVEPGEDLSEAIRRELREELGAQVEILAEIGVVSDYYNLIHRHNINHYFLCRAMSFGDRRLTEDEIDKFHLSTLKLSYDEAVAEYERRACTRLGRLIANRELPILKRAREWME